MENNFKITIPKPCHEDWNGMIPEDNGRFCAVCTKSVVDFTKKTSDEIQEYFNDNQHQKICGRFKNEQINRFDIQIPQSIFYKKMPFHKSFLLVLFAVMGSSLFSCKNHNDDIISTKPTLVEDTTISKHITGAPLPFKKNDKSIGITLGKIDEHKRDSLIKAGVKLPPIPPKNVKTNDIILGEPKKESNDKIIGDTIYAPNKFNQRK